MRAETSAYSAERKKYTVQPNAYVRLFHVQKHGDGTEYAFSRDFAWQAVLSAAKTKLICLTGLGGNTQTVDPIEGKSSIGTLTVELTDRDGEVLRQVSDPARPLATAIPGTPHHRRHGRSSPNVPADSARVPTQFGASSWTQSGMTLFAAASVNDGDIGVTAFNADTAGVGAFLQFDAGAGNTRKFNRVRVATAAATGAEHTWDVEWSDDATTWTAVATGFKTGGTDFRERSIGWRQAEARRYWRLKKTDAAAVGANYTEVQFYEGGYGIAVDDVSVYPSVGHVTIGSEDFKYTGIDKATNAFTGVTAAQRGTSAGDHDAGALVRNGEQIRRGMRLTLFLGYAPLVEADYGPSTGYIRMVVQSVRSPAPKKWQIRCADLQRFVRKKIFERATSDNPVTLGPKHPLTIFLEVLLSTGNRTNTAYDVLRTYDSLGVPSALVDVSGIEKLRDAELPAGLTMVFAELEPTDGKLFLESQIARPLNLVPIITQDGKYSLKRLRTPEFRGAGVQRAAAVSD